MMCLKRRRISTVSPLTKSGSLKSKLMKFLFIILLVYNSYLHREERGKVDVKFTVKFKKETKYPLKPLYEQIAKDSLGNMPVYRDTLIRGGRIFHLLDCMPYI